MKIMFVDSEENHVIGLALMLKQYPNKETIISTNAQKAIKAAEQGGVDIIVLDTCSPFPNFKLKDYSGPASGPHAFGAISDRHKSGIQALIEIKKVNPKQRVIMTTTSPAIEKNPDLLKSLGAEEVLIKIFDPEELLKMLN